MRKENRIMKRKDRIHAVISVIVILTTSLLLVGVSTYYCDLFWLRLVCIVIAGWNGNIGVSRAREVFGKNRTEKLEDCIR